MPRFCGVYLLAYMIRDELAKLGRENAFEKAAEAARIARSVTLGEGDSDVDS